MVYENLLEIEILFPDFMGSHKKFGPDRFCRFDVYWIQTNKQTDRQA